LPAINGELLERDRFAARDLGHNFAAVDALELFFAAHLNTQRMADSTMTTTTGEMIATRQQSAQRKQRLFGKAQLMQAGRARRIRSIRATGVCWTAARSAAAGGFRSINLVLSDRKRPCPRGSHDDSAGTLTRLIP
jgi:hypothetical protein